MKLNPVFECYFITQRPDVETPYVDGDTFYSNGIETIPTISRKTIAAFEYFLDKGYDYILRTNLSSVWNFPVYEPIVNSLPKTDVLRGVIGGDFVSGAGFLLSLDVAQKMIDHQDEIFSYTDTTDDLAIGHVMKRIGVPFMPAQRTDITSADSVVKDPNAYHYRCKLPTDRSQEPIVIRKLVEMIYKQNLCFMIPIKLTKPEEEIHIKRCLQSIRTFYPYELVVICVSKDSIPLTISGDANTRFIKNEYFGALGALFIYNQFKFDDRAIILHDSMVVTERLGIDTSAPAQCLYHFYEPGMETIHYEKSYRELLDHASYTDMVATQKFGCFGAVVHIYHSAIKYLNILPIIPRVKTRSHGEAMERILAYLMTKHKVGTPEKSLCGLYNKIIANQPESLTLSFEEVCRINKQGPIFKIILRRV